ncbi:hypothetical protein SNEBB_010558 [Seison nebaliae]|nr:hypothetical protein SNEBB_010558 [Seison nebaliae]
MKKSKKTYQNDCDIPSLDSIMEETLKNSLTSKSDEEEEEEEKEVEEIGSKLNLQFIRQNQYNLKKMRRELNKNDQLNDLQVKSCVYSKTKRILVVAYNDGSISVHPLAATHQIENKSAKKLRMENEEENSNENIMNDVKIFGGELSLLYVVGVVTLTNSDISSLTFNSPKDDWVAIGCKESGNITIWDWSSQIVVLKQNYRQNQILSLAHSPDKNYISLGLSNGFVQIWDSVTAICYMTFKEHTQNVNSLEFAPNSRSLFSGSSDGTIRAYDLNRYRNFRTFTTPRESQVETMSVDSSGEIIAASGSLNDFSIYIWSVQTGLLLDTLSGHEAKISSIKFSPLKNVTLFSGEGENFSAPNVIATCSWDGSLRLTNIYDSKRSTDILNVSNECITVAWQNDGKIIAISTTTCKIIFYSIENGNELNEINGLYDIGFQRTSQSTTAKKRGTSQYFTCLDYSTDNRLLLAAANSPLICLYDAKLYQLLQRFTLTTNLSVSGVVGMFNEKHLNRYEKRDNKNILKLPGTTEIDPGERYMTHKLIVRQVNFSSTDTLFSVLSSEGCMIFSNEIDLSYDIFSSTNSFDRIELEEMNLNDSKDDYQLFPPFFINETISTKIIKDHIDKKEYQLSLLKSLKYGRYSLIRETFNSIKINCSNIDALINDFIEFTLCTNDSCIRLILLLRFIDSLSYSLDKLISIDFIITLIERLLWNNCGAFQKLLYSHDKVKSIQENIKMNVTTSTSDEDIMKTNENIEIKENHLQYLDEKNLIEQLKLSLIRLQKRLNEKPKDLVDLQQNVTSSFQFVCEQLKLKQ